MCTSIQTWLDNITGHSSDTFPDHLPTPFNFTPPPSQPLSGKRHHERTSKKRAMPSSPPRSTSPPKRRRRASDDNAASGNRIAESVASDVTSLSDRTRFTYLPETTPRRSPSPVRDLLRKLRYARPPVLHETPANIKDCPSEVLGLKRRLASKANQSYIPIGLKESISNTFPTIADDIHELAWDSSYRNDLGLQSLWKESLEILRTANKCCLDQQDENAWVTKVVLPILKIALRDNEWLEVESVQSQLINSAFLSSLPNASKGVSKKADFAFSFTSDQHEVNSLYGQLESNGLENIGHTTDQATRRLALYSGIEVKPENGGKDEALAQLSIWLVAAMENLKRLRLKGTRPSMLDAETNATPAASVSMTVKPMVGCTIIGHDWHFYIAFVSEPIIYSLNDDNETTKGRTLNHEEDKYIVVGPWQSLESSTRDIIGLLKILAIMKEVGKIAQLDYWPWLRDDVLLPLIL